MKLVVGIILSTSLFAVVPARSADYLVAGVGNDSCGTFVQEATVDSERYRMEMSWVQGFLAAQNGITLVELSKKVGGSHVGNVKLDILDGTDFNGQALWLNNWCTNHPLENVASAATALTLVLTDRLTQRIRAEAAP